MTLTDDVIETFNDNNYYKILGIEQNSNEQNIKKAYLAKSLEFHPDKTTDLSKKEEYKRKFQILSQIYKTLIDEETRFQYDKILLLSDQSSSSGIVDEVPLKECFESEDFYGYYCRCSGTFILGKDILTNSTLR